VALTSGDVTERQRAIAAELGVPREFDAEAEAARRIEFLADALVVAGSSGYVLGISGGVDSATAGRLAQLACERARSEGRDATFVAVRLPYGRQADEDDAQRALAFIRPDHSLSVDVKPATDALRATLNDLELPLPFRAPHDYVTGNIKARERMVAQYAIGNAHGLLVIGTDHAAEAVTGFFTKHGDGACDLTPLAGLTKRRVRAVAEFLGAEERIVGKVPTADLEDERPGLPDETALGLTYDEIDDFLEGEPVSADVHDRIVARFDATAHKRALPAAPS
jgi:NAD+ synthase